MRITSLAIIVVLLSLMGCASGGQPRGPRAFNPDEIRAAERAVIVALESPDPTAWVYLYTEDAVLLEPGAAPIAGRPALLQMARAMRTACGAWRRKCSFLLARKNRSDDNTWHGSRASVSTDRPGESTTGRRQYSAP